MTRARTDLARPLVAIAMLWCAGLVAAGQFAKIAVPFSQVRDAYPHVGGEIGWLLSLVSLVGAVLGVVAGGLVSRIGAARLLIGGLLLGSALSAWQATGPSFVAMLLGRMAEGLSHLAIVVAAPVLIARIAPASLLGAAMALWSTFFGVAFALTAWLGLPLVDRYGLGTLFAAHALLTFAVAVSLSLILYRSGGFRPEGTASSRTPDRRDGPLALHIAAYRGPRIAGPGLGWLFYTLTFVSLLAVLPGLLPERLAEEARAAITGLMPLASIATSLLVVPLLLRLMRATTIVIAGFALAVSILAGALAGLPLAPLALALFAALGLVQGASFVAVTELNARADDRALGYGVMAQTGNIGNLCGTPLLLAVLAQGGEAGVLAGTGVLYLMAIAACLVLRHLVRRGPAREVRSMTGP